MENQIEIWKPIPGYEGYYEVSSFGRVKSLKRIVGKNYPIKERILKQFIYSGCYYGVNLYKNRKVKTRNVHQLVAEAFFGHIPCGYELVVDHINTDDPNNKLNNNISNLRVITQRENSNNKNIKRTSKYEGVHLNKDTNKWRASIHINSKNIHLGTFASELEASEYYKNAIFCHKNNLPIKTSIKKKSSTYKGVCFRHKINKWEANIIINTKHKYIGTFNTEIEAHNAYQNALKTAS